VDTHHISDVEVYPKQDDIGNGLGSLIRLPFGIHRLSGRRYGFYGSDNKPLGSTIREQISSLQSPNFVSKVGFETYIANSSPPTTEALSNQLHETTGPVSERIKAHVSVFEFLSQYVELKPTATGAVGLCPFHNDQHPSLGVNDKENYWHCFAGCGGGSVIDFWSKWRENKGLDSSFVDTITELADMLL